MAGVSKINIIGNLGRDPETRFTQNGQMNVSFSVAVNHRRPNGEDIANWFRVTVWGRLAETLDRLVQEGAFTTGKQVYVCGTFIAREYRTQQGEARTSLDLNADVVQLLGARSGDDQSANPEQVPF